MPKEHEVTAIWQTLKIPPDNAQSKGTWAGPALSRRWEQVTFGDPSKKKLVCKSRTHFSVIRHLKSSKIWTNSQRTKLWLTENHTHTHTWRDRISHWEICCSVSFPNNVFATRQILQHSPPSARLLRSAGYFGIDSHDFQHSWQVLQVSCTRLTVWGVTAEVTPSSSTQAQNQMQIFRWPLSENGTIFRTFGYQTICLTNLNLQFLTLWKTCKVNYICRPDF